MSLKELIDTINRIAKAQPAINGIVDTGDIYSLNTDTAAKYATFCLVQQQHIQTGEEMQYGFYLYYVDRLKNDKSNRVQIQSTGIQVLANILNTLKFEADIEIDTVVYQPFQQKFNDECAGVYADIRITDEVETLCEETY